MEHDWTRKTWERRSGEPDGDRCGEDGMDISGAIEECPGDCEDVERAQGDSMIVGGGVAKIGWLC